MSIEVHVFADHLKIPSRDVWQSMIEQLGFPAVLDSQLNLQKDTGFTPATYEGEETGFEFYLESATDILLAYPHIQPHVGSRDICATFRWGGDLTECAAAMSASAALTKLTDGVYFYPDDDLVYNADEAIETTRKDLSLNPLSGAG